MDAQAGSQQVVLSIENGRARISLNRAEVGNALSPSMVEELDRAVDQAHECGVRLIVFEGRGRHMCTGFDLSDIDDCSDGDLLLRFVRIELLLQKIHASPVVTTAIASGRVYGGGADIFTACDRRIGLPNASFAFPGSSFGLVLGTRRLASRIGNDTTRRILLSGAELPVEAAVEIGLVTDPCTAEDVEDRLTEIAAGASRLESVTIAALHAKTISRDDDADLAALVNSASRPKLKERIKAYRQRAMAARKK